MARHCRMLPVPGFSDCSWAICDVDMGRPEATRNVLERANLVMKSPHGWFENSNGILSDKPHCMPLRFGIIGRRCNHIARGGRGFLFLHIFFLSLLFLSFFLPLPLIS